MLRTFKHRFVKAYLRWGRQTRPPRAINVEPTNICNLACPICPHGAMRAGLIPEFMRPRGYLALTTFERILTECQHAQIRAMALYLHGEPFLHPDLPEMVKRAQAKQIFVNLFSNGLAVRPAQLDQTLRAQPQTLTISMDLMSQEGYLRYKGSDHFAEASAQLRMIASVCERRRAQTRLILRTIYDREDQAAVQHFLARWFAVPGLETIQLTHAFPWPGRTDADLLAHRVAAVQQGECPQVWNALNICWDGTVTPCSYDYDAAYPIGHILEASLPTILNSPAARHFRRMHILGKSAAIALCARCLLPRFFCEIITVERQPYLTMSSADRQKLLDRITHLRFSPLQDFP